jgi:hypothetical protein
MVFEVHDLNIRRRLRQHGNNLMCASAFAFDPSSQLVASAWWDNYAQLWTL